MNNLKNKFNKKVKRLWGSTKENYIKTLENTGKWLKDDSIERKFKIKANNFRDSLIDTKNSLIKERERYITTIALSIEEILIFKLFQSALLLSILKCLSWTQLELDFYEDKSFPKVRVLWDILKILFGVFTAMIGNIILSGLFVTMFYYGGKIIVLKERDKSIVFKFLIVVVIIIKILIGYSK